jgi:hypothetical protein
MHRFRHQINLLKIWLGVVVWEQQKQVGTAFTKELRAGWSSKFLLSFFFLFCVLLKIQELKYMSIWVYLLFCRQEEMYIDDVWEQVAEKNILTFH